MVIMVNNEYLEYLWKKKTLQLSETFSTIIESIFNEFLGKNLTIFSLDQTYPTILALFW